MNSLSNKRLSEDEQSSNSWQSNLTTPRSSFSASSGPPFKGIPNNHYRKITPPEEKTISRELCTVEKSKSSCLKIWALVEQFNTFCSQTSSDCMNVEPFSTKLSFEDYIALSRKLREDSDRRYPQCSYNSKTSTFVIEFMPGPLHETFTSFLITAFVIQFQSLPPAIRSKFTVIPNLEYKGFGNGYLGSEKTPDVQIRVKDAEGERNIKLVVEVGFSEPYKQLEAEMKLWIEGESSVSVAILVKLTESPKYRCPVNDLDDDEIDQLNFPPTNEIKERLFSLESSGNELGPVIYKNLVWVGRLSSAVLEIWRRDLETGLAVRRDQKDLFTTGKQLDLHLSDFMTVDPNQERTMSIDLEEINGELQDSMKLLAANRCIEMLRDLEKRRGGLGDSDYIPESQSSGSS